jgi:biotin carboxyl carrier protein
VLVVVESMKMNNEIRAPRDGVIADVHVRPGERVERNALLVTLQ